MIKKLNKKQAMTLITLSLLLSFTILLHTNCTVYAAGEAATGEAVIKAGFNTIYGLVAAIVSSIGSLFLLWGVFEWAQAMNVQDGGAQSMAFKRIAGGLVAVITPQLIPVITASVGTV